MLGKDKIARVYERLIEDMGNIETIIERNHGTPIEEDDRLPNGKLFLLDPEIVDLSANIYARLNPELVPFALHGDDSKDYFKRPMKGTAYSEHSKCTAKNWQQYCANQDIDRRACANIAIITGKKSGIVGLDIDIQDRGLEIWEQYVSAHGWPDTWTVRTGSGGYHLYFQYDDRFKHSTKIITIDGKKVGWDIRTDSGYLVAPPSIHAGASKETLQFYNWLDWKRLLRPPGKIPDTLWSFIEENSSSKYIPRTSYRQSVSSSSTSSPKQPISNDEISKLVSLLSDTRADEYDDWRNVGFVLRELCGYTDELLPLWHEFSKRCPEKYDPADCEQHWARFKPCPPGKKPLSIGSLKMWAKTDSPDQFKEVINQITVSSYDVNDPYYFCDFVAQYAKDGNKRHIYDDGRNDGKDIFWAELVKDLSRVVRLKEVGCKLVFTKDSEKVLFSAVNIDTFDRNNRRYKYRVTVTRSKDEGWDLGKMNALRLAHEAHNSSVSEKDGILTFTYEEPLFTPLFRYTSLHCNVVDNIPYRPDQPPAEAIKSKVLNMFPGWGSKIVPEVDMSLIEPFLEFMFDIICNGDRDHYEYLLNWESYMVQYPAEPAGSALLLLSGRQGCGKSIFMGFNRRMVGIKASFECSGTGQFVGQFNAILEGMLLGLIEEVKRNDRGAKDVYNLCKHSITGGTMMIEPKGVNKYMVTNRLHLILSSNYGDCLKLDPDDRRFFVIHLNESRCMDKDYFDPFVDIMKGSDNKVFDHLLTYFMRRTLPHKWTPQFVPVTEAKKTMIKKAQDNVADFLDAIRSGEWPRKGRGYFDPETKASVSTELQLHYKSRSDKEGLGLTSKSHLYKHYQAYCQAAGEHRPKKLKDFNSRMEALYGKYKCGKCKVPDDDGVETQSQVAVHYIPLPDLSGCE